MSELLQGEKLEASQATANFGGRDQTSAATASPSTGEEAKQEVDVPPFLKGILITGKSKFELL